MHITIMLKSILAFATLVATGITIPVADNPSKAETLARSASIPVEVSGACYYPAGISCPSQSQNITGEVDNGKTIGLVVQNKDTVAHTYFVYKNDCNCVPVKYITIPANEKRFISFTPDFRGRITRGTIAANLDGNYHLLGTWMEFSWDSNGWGWADISLIKGCDGAVDVQAIDGIGAKIGFTDDVLSDAPTAAYKQKSGSGARVIMETESLTDPNIINEPPRDWLAGRLGFKKAYIDDHHGNPDICSVNGRFHVNFYKGWP